MTAPQPLTETERRVADAVDIEGLVDATRRLVRIRSDAGDETACQEAVAALMRDAGLETDVWDIDLPTVQDHPAASWEVDRARALGVVGRLPGTEPTDGPTLVLNGHVDVVPPGHESDWTHPPFAGALEQGRLYGRGALDMKGPLMAGLHAMAAVERAGVRLRGTVLLHSVVGEEDGGIGTLAAILRGHTGDAAIVMEPTRLQVAPIQSGCINFRVVVPGRAAHGATRTEGVSAIEKLYPLHRALLALEAERNEPYVGRPLYGRGPIPFPLSVGTVRGGSWASSVPEQVVIEGRLGVLPGETMPEARSALEQAVGAAARQDSFLRTSPPVVEWWGGRFYPVDTPVEAPIVDTLSTALRDLTGNAPGLEAVPFGADAGLFAHVAAMPVVLFGAGDIRRAHRPDEYVDVEELVLMSRTLAVTALRYCGVSE